MTSHDFKRMIPYGFCVGSQLSGLAFHLQRNFEFIFRLR
jgi:hypothetical protein